MNVIYFNSIQDYVIKVINHVLQHGNHLDTYRVDSWGSDEEDYLYLLCHKTNTIWSPGPAKEYTNSEIFNYIYNNYIDDKYGIMEEETLIRFNKMLEDKYLIKMAKLQAFW